MAPYIGGSVSRIDGIAKVTGTAKYAAEFNVSDLVYGFVVTSTIAKGRIRRIETGRAMRVRGVLDVLTHSHRPAMADDEKAYKDDVAPLGSPFRPLYDDKVAFSGQPIALVLAETSEIARYAASLVKVEYEKEAHNTDFRRRLDAAKPVEAPTNAFEALFTPPKTRGEPDRALAAAAVRHAAEYSTPIEHHNPMELYAATAVHAKDGRLTVYDKTQGVQNVQRYLVHVFGMKPDDLRVVSPFVGGAFGVGLRPQFEVVLAVLGARALKRSVRVILTRQQMYALGYRPATLQRVALGSSANGTLEVVTQDAVTVTSQYEDYYRQETGWSGLLYTSGNAGYSHRLAKVDLPTSCDMRCPSAATGVYALECAIDELAIALNTDPLEFRLGCYSELNQNTGQRFSSKALRECYRKGAEAFGWSRRNPNVRSMRDGGDLIGWGMATGVWDAWQAPITVRIVLTAAGRATVECATSDIGTGTYTIMAQVAADMLGVPLEDVSVKLGDSNLPQSPVEGGSWMAASVSNGIATTAKAIRDELLRMAQKMMASHFEGLGANDVELSGGNLVSKIEPSRLMAIADVMRYHSVDRVEQSKSTAPAKDSQRSHNAHSAVFAEVKVDGQLGVIRVTRVVSAVAAGRILNAKTARSQILGSVVWGIGMALQEETQIDHRYGRVMNANIAEYHVPVNADIQDIEIIFVDEYDDSNPLGVKGLGEIGIVGVAAAIANAVHHATGKRIRGLPITIDKLMT